MAYPSRPAASLAVAPGASQPQTNWTNRPDRRPQRAKPLTRRYEIAYLSAAGSVEQTTRLAPALPQFEDAFSAIARGTLITTDRGTVAIEDLRAGDRVLTMENGPEPVLWIGSMMLYPAGATPGFDSGGLVRITADRFGYARPHSDLLLGPSARLLHRHARVAEIIGVPSALAPVRGFVDGMGVIRVDPISPVPVFHLCLAQHRTIRASGIEIESFHPGPASDAMLDPELMSLFLAFFPHIRKIEDFGPLAHPRLTRFETEAMLAG